MPTKGKKTDAIALLKDDHEKVKELFEKFDETKGSATKAKIVADAIKELKVQRPEEELFYPALRQKMDDEEESWTRR